MQPFESLTQTEQQKRLMPILIKILQNLGGKATRNEIKEEIRTSVAEIPENALDEVKPAKDGSAFHPFAFVFNYSVISLEIAGFLVRSTKSEITLTEKGRICNTAQLNVDKEVIPFAKAKWNKKKKENLSELEQDIDETNKPIDITEQWKAELKQHLLNMPPNKFELFCRALVNKMGVDIDESKGVSATKDGGIDGYGYIVSDDFRTSRVAIQAKRWNKEQTIGTPEIDQFAGAMAYNNAEFGVFITTAKFSRNAVERARSGQRAITLIDGDKIIELVEKYQLYIKPVTTFQLERFYTEGN